MGGDRVVGDNDDGNKVIGVNYAPLRPGVHQLNFTLIAGVGEGAAVFGRLQVFSPSFSSSFCRFDQNAAVSGIHNIGSSPSFLLSNLDQTFCFFLHTSILLQ